MSSRSLRMPLASGLLHRSVIAPNETLTNLLRPAEVVSTECNKPHAEGVPLMRRLLLGIVLALGLVYVAPATTATSATATVQITKTGFVPASVTINAGDSVTWRNADKVNHQVVANGGQFASPILSPGETYTHTFNGGGTFRYHDALHTSLRGTVVVKGPPPQVTLAASSALVKYGTQVTLSGTVSNKKAGETVTLVQLPFGQTTKQVIATLQPTTGGAFSFTVTPQIYTQYQAQWPNRS